jgi:hypothetical protein
MDMSTAIHPWDSSPHSVESYLDQSNWRESFLAALDVFAAFFALACALFLCPWVNWSLGDRFKKVCGGLL